MNNITEEESIKLVECSNGLGPARDGPTLEKLVRDDGRTEYFLWGRRLNGMIVSADVSESLDTAIATFRDRWFYQGDLGSDEASRYAKQLGPYFTVEEGEFFWMIKREGNPSPVHFFPKASLGQR